MRALGLIILIALVYVGATFAHVWWTAAQDRAQPADAIIVMGAAQYQGRPSPVFAARLDHAAALYARDLAPVVVVTGGSQPGDRVSEAFAGYSYLQRRGVPESALRLEVDGRTSYESLSATARFLRDEAIEDVIVVSDGWHLARSAQIAESVGLTALPSPAPGSPYSGARSLQQMVRETGALSVGRLIGFRRLDNLSSPDAG
ncbi:YdcF family protein [soil metagenome]